MTERQLRGNTAEAAAVIIGGAIDGIVNESLQDPGYDTGAAAEQLIAMVEAPN